MATTNNGCHKATQGEGLCILTISNWVIYTLSERRAIRIRLSF